MSKNKKTKRNRYLTQIQKTREAMRAQIRCVIGCDDNVSGICVRAEYHKRNTMEKDTLKSFF